MLVLLNQCHHCNPKFSLVAAVILFDRCDSIFQYPQGFRLYSDFDILSSIDYLSYWSHRDLEMNWDAKFSR